MKGRIKVVHVITRLDRGGSAQNTLLTCLGLTERYELVLVHGLSLESQMTDWEKQSVDSGIEKALLMGVDEIQNFDEPDKFGVSYGYEVKITCCNAAREHCAFEAGVFECPVGVEVSDDCQGSYFCYKSIGNYKGIKRAIETER